MIVKCIHDAQRAAWHRDRAIADAAVVDGVIIIEEGTTTVLPQFCWHIMPRTRRCIVWTMHA